MQIIPEKAGEDGGMSPFSYLQLYSSSCKRGVVILARSGFHARVIR